MAKHELDGHSARYIGLDIFTRCTCGWESAHRQHKTHSHPVTAALVDFRAHVKEAEADDVTAALLAALRPFVALLGVADGDVTSIEVRRSDVRPLVLAAVDAIAKAEGR